MRPPGEISVAILDAAAAMERREAGGQRRGATLQELAHRACVGLQAARNTVANMRRHGRLEPVAERRVEYRNRPVVEYAPAVAADQTETSCFDVAEVFRSWVQA